MCCFLLYHPLKFVFSEQHHVNVSLKDTNTTIYTYVGMYTYITTTFKESGLFPSSQYLVHSHICICVYIHTYMHVKLPKAQLSRIETTVSQHPSSNLKRTSSKHITNFIDDGCVQCCKLLKYLDKPKKQIHM